MRVRILLSTMACLLFMSASTVAQSSSKPPVQTPPAPQGANQALPGIGAPMKGSATKGVGSIKPGAALGKTAPVDNSEINNRPKKMIKSNEQWRRELTPMEYSVTREGGTERAFSGKYWNYKKDGIYVCTCCDLVLFDAKTKFESGTGWPSYWQPAKPESILEIRDTSHGMMRREVRCSRCDAHLGHVFADGPRPTGQRYCINSAALKFIQKADGKLKSGEKQGAPGQSPAGTNESEGSAAGKNDKK